MRIARRCLFSLASWFSLSLGLWGAEAFAQDWVALVNQEIDHRIRQGAFDLVLENFEYVDSRDGLMRYDGPNKKRSFIPPSKSLDLGGDQHTLALAKVESVLIRNCTIRANRVEEALKLSASKDVVVDNCVLFGGDEDALDIVRGSDYVFRNVRFIARGNYAVTIKGGVQRVDFIGCTFEGEPKTGYFIDLGNWSDYDVLERPKTDQVRIDDTTVFANGRVGGKPYAVRVIHAEPPNMVGHLAIMPGMVWKTYFAYKRYKDGSAILERLGSKELCWDLYDCPINPR